MVLPHSIQSSLSRSSALGNRKYRDITHTHTNTYTAAYQGPPYWETGSTETSIYTYALIHVLGHRYRFILFKGINILIIHADVCVCMCMCVCVCVCVCAFVCVCVRVIMFEAR